METKKTLPNLTLDYMDAVEQPPEVCIRNITYRVNHENIKRAIESYIDEGRIPVIAEIATAANVTRQTVHAHMNDIRDFYISAQNPELVALRRARVMEKLYHHAAGRWDEPTTPSSQLKAMELYLKFTDPGGNGSGKTVNIQINS